jgi:hypothetical protein
MSYEPISSIIFSEEFLRSRVRACRTLKFRIGDNNSIGWVGGGLGFCSDFQPLLTQTRKLETRLPIQPTFFLNKKKLFRYWLSSSKFIASITCPIKKNKREEFSSPQKLVHTNPNEMKVPVEPTPMSHYFEDEKSSPNVCLSDHPSGIHSICFQG